MRYTNTLTHTHTHTHTHTPQRERDELLVSQTAAKAKILKSALYSAFV